MGCNIDKMLIKGIRSFSPDNQNVIEFYRPLTLIVGHNGAGKTTVIECLKMACTGELPPNTRSGQSFIHDPKVAGETEVKAQIKLRFVTSTRQPVVIIRSFQLTQKKSTMQFKALDNVLQTINRETGSKEALSYRCADIDRIVPQLMGVSKAVLENVIFVHQEESNWPLAEGQVLKKKFDDIFAATKYTKALEVLRKLQTDKNNELKLMRAQLEHTRTLKDQAQKLKNDIETGTAKSLQYQDKIAQLDGECQAAQQRLDELSNQLAQIADFGDELTKLRTQHEMVARQNAEAWHLMKSRYGDEDAGLGVEELREMKAQLDPNMANNEQNMRRLQRDIQIAGIDVEAAKEQYTRDVKQQGRLAAEAEAHARNLAELEGFLRDVCGQAGVVPMDGSAAAAAACFHERLAEVTRQLDDRKAANRKMDDDLGKQIDKVNAELSGRVEAQRLKREAMQRNAYKASELQGQLEHHLVSPAMLEDASQHEKQLEAALAAKDAQLGASNFDAEVQQVTNQLNDLNRRASDLRRERDQLALSSEHATKLRLKAQELHQKEMQLDGMRRAAQQRLNQLLGAPVGAELPPADELLARVAAAVGQRSREVEGLQREAAELQAAEASGTATLAAVRRQLEAAQKERAALDAQLQAGLASAGGPPEASFVPPTGTGTAGTAGTLGTFASGTLGSQAGPSGPPTPARVVEHRTQALEKQRAEDTDKLAQMKSFARFANTFKQNAQAHNICMTCSRPFGSEQERRQFIAKQDQEVERVPTMSAELEGKLSQVQQHLHRLRSLQPAASRHDTLTTKDIPDLRRRVEEAEAKLKADAEKREDNTESLGSAQHELEEGRKLQEEVQAMDRLARDIRDRRAEVEALQRSAAATAATRSVADVDRDLEDLEAQKTNAENQRTELQRRHNRLRDEVAHLRSEHQRAREELLRLQASAEKRTSTQKQVDEIFQQNEALQQEIEAAQAERQPKEDERGQLMQEREAKRREWAAGEAEKEQELRQLHTWETQLAAKQRAIDEYVQLGKAEALHKVNAALEGLRQTQEAGEAKLKELQQEYRELQEQKADQSDFKRQIDDLLAYHEGKGREAQLAEQLDRLNAAQGGVGDKGAIDREYASVDGRLQKLRSDADMMRGSLRTVQERVAICQQDLSVAQYHEIDTKYRQQNIEVKTTEMAQSDLAKYHKALEKALLSFHTSKMADINKIVKELWQKTYRNSDIDYIQIKADQEGAAGRSYNYRVVMHTGCAELDMRGRCSAGQKVLACLIIRLALAETFCLNCGILALDEPTTNLDADNSASLAEALRTIMQNRRDQENFQLVVITHDEVFARLIGTREHAEYMWRITKDETQHSTITQEDIME